MGIGRYDMPTESSRMTKPAADILMVAALAVLLLAAGCGRDVVPQSPSFIYKTDSNGTVAWITSLDTGMQDSASTIIETSDGDYLVAASVSDNPHGFIVHQTFPRFLRIDSAGHVRWDQVLNSTHDTVNYSSAGGATTVLEKNDGNLLGGSSCGWIFSFSPEGMVKNISSLDNRGISAIATQDGGILIVGDKTMKFDAAGNLTWEAPLMRSTRAFQTSDGRFLLDHDMGRNDTVHGISCLSRNGSTLWTYELDRWDVKPETSFYESSPGVVDFTYSGMIWDRDATKEASMTKQLTFNPQGQMIGKKNLSAAGPLIRTPDGGYVFVSIPLGERGQFTSDYSKDTVLHIVKLSADGSTVWDKPLTPSGFYYPISIIPTRDGGYVALVGLDVLRVG